MLSYVARYFWLIFFIRRAKYLADCILVAAFFRVITVIISFRLFRLF